jgi:hypothetical protein
MGLLSVVAIAPRWAQVWLAIAAFDVFLAAFAYSYVVPRRHLPAWLRSDIESGRIDEARPNRDDWLLFWMFMTLAVFLNVGGPALVLGFFKR